MLPHCGGRVGARKRRRACVWVGGSYVALCLLTWMLGWDPLSFGSHGPVQVLRMCTASSPPQWCVTTTPDEIMQPEAPALSSASPLISAMCITKMGRSEMLDIALRRFRAQTYPNKEIVVVYDVGNAGASEVVDRHATLSTGTGVRVIGVVNHKGKAATLGELRNQAITATSGEVVVQWDDDDWYSAERVETQYRALVASQGGDAVLLQRYTLFETLTGLLWCVRLVHHHACVRHRIAGLSAALCRYNTHYSTEAGSIMARRRVFESVQYQHTRLSEDSVLVEASKKHGFRFVVLDDPSIYVRIIHDKNSWDRAHFMNFYKERSGTPSWSERRSLKQQLVADGIRPSSWAWLRGWWKSLPLTYEVEYFAIKLDLL